MNFQSMYDGVRAARARRRSAAARSPHHVRGRHDTRSRAAQRGGALLRRTRQPARSTSARSYSTRRCPTTCSIPTVPKPPPPSSTTRPRWPRSLLRSGHPNSLTARGPRVLRTIGESYRNFSVVALREAELRSELARVPEEVLRVPTFERDIGDLDGLVEIGRYLFGDPRERSMSMTTVFELARARTALGRGDLVHVERLVASWRPLADLSFADLLLLAPIAGEEGHRFVVLAQVRPVTGQTNYPQDLVGSVVDEVERPLLTRCWRTGEIVDGDTPAIGSKERVRVQCIPMRHHGRLIAVLTQESAISFMRREGELERDVSRGGRSLRADGFRGLVSVSGRRGRSGECAARRRRRDRHRRRDAESVSPVPNAVSSLHRMGIHAYAQGQLLADVGFDDAGARSAMQTRLPGFGGDRARRGVGADPSGPVARCRCAWSARSS